MSSSARFIKGTDVAHTLRNKFGKRASDPMLRDLSRLVQERIDQWGKGTHLKKVQTWQPDEDELRKTFGGKLAMLRCWRCAQKKKDVSHSGALCGACKQKEGGA